MQCIERLERRCLLAQTAGWSEVIDNPYFPLIPGTTYLYTGEVEGERQTGRTIVTGDTKVIKGVTCTVVHDRVFVNGELAEKTYDWYAQDDQGNVWYFGEDSRDIEDGKVVSREGSWEAGVNGAKPGIIMKARPDPSAGPYFQEFAVGVAEDQAQVLDLHSNAKTPFATFNNCLKTQEFSTLDPDVVEEKFYAPGIGFIFANAVQGESESLKLKAIELAPSAMSPVIDNPYMPLTPGSVWVYKGVSDGTPETNRIIVTDTTRVVAGITTTVVLDRVFEEGELTEKTYDFFAQDKIGNVWYFGEDSRDVEDGKVVGRGGSWEAGVNGARPGIVMLAYPSVGDDYPQENAPGVAEDRGQVLARKVNVTVPFGTFSKCVKTKDYNPLEPDSVEHKYYAPGIGLVKEQAVVGDPEFLKLIDFIPG